MFTLIIATMTEKECLVKRLNDLVRKVNEGGNFEDYEDFDDMLESEFNAEELYELGLVDIPQPTKIIDGEAEIMYSLKNGNGENYGF